MRYSFDTAKHLHTLDSVPLIGTTTALSVIHKPLAYWASGMAVGMLGWLHKDNGKEACLEAATKALEAIKGMDPIQYHAVLNLAYRAHDQKKKDTADKGVDLHAACEEYIKWKLGGSAPKFTPEVEAQLKPFIEWSDKNVRKFLFSEIHCYSEKLWVGGIVDLACEMKNGIYLLGDFKSAPKPYFSNFVQMGGYDIQLMENGGFDSEGNKIWEPKLGFAAHGVFNFGGGFKEPTISGEVVRNKEAFVHAVGLYKTQQAWEKEFKVEKYR